MPAKKTSGTKKNTSARSTNTRSGSAKKKNGAAAAQKQEKIERVAESKRAIHQLMPWILGLVAVLITLALFVPQATGLLGEFIKNLLLGLFSAAGYTVPIILVVMAIFWKKDVDHAYVPLRIVFGSLSLISFAVILHGIGGNTETFNMIEMYGDGCKLIGGGALGGFVGSLFRKCIGMAGLYIVSITLFVLMTIFLFGLTPRVIIQYISSYIRETKQRRTEADEEEAVYTDKPEPFVPEEYREGAGDDDEPPFDVDVPTDDDYALLEEGRATFEELLADNNTYEPIEDDMETDSQATESRATESLAPVVTEQGKKKFPDAEGEVDLAAIFGEDLDLQNGQFVPADGALLPDGEIADEAELEIERSPLIEDEPEVIEPMPEPEKPKPAPPKYVFPPISLLTQDTKPITVDKAELEKNAVRLVETLASFKVRTKIVNIAHGPTITRYELAPEEGVRVRAISNLVDDIALSLATSGVRIEAPIPGKAAVGIEVPNKNVAIVRLRELLESEMFKKNKSRIAVALGMDVAGAPIFLDIAKMPHLLIAGATGMGKSVCINSMIVSLLYKATPEEVKLILIDPKKVELNIYNSLPHLLVPVVSDPKKAAGSLQWAVNEMERRFELIESVGVRDIYNYNLMTKDDPTFEFLPQIVIIIDELADLMMTAPDSVEDSVCRLAQKARAAGMHLIIGTQRPSVDVITGLIKANIPSRIAFTVASQVDSRTIIDISGAEKLIGRGDMLYAPVGASKPIRVQGAFVSEQEVEAITGFIKNKVGESEYNDRVLEEIEREAAKCTTKKGASSSSGASLEDGGDDGETDPMLKSAIELAIDAGKISTSLIQRRLSLGYGRAAKLIDKMEQMGIVGPPEGNKPREVRLTRQEYMEMVVNNDDF